MKGLAINPEAVAEILTRFIHAEVTKVGFGRVVIGLSGGVDSATSAALGARALGPQNVRTYYLPYKTSSPLSREDALQVADFLGVHWEEIDITPMVDPYLARDPAMDAVRRGNVMARERMIVLYDQSALHEALVLGTSNKTEYLLGYTTLWGDMACALTPLGDLYKTQVRALAAHLGIPAAIVEKSPTADLWAGQTDEGELGFTYAAVDDLLYQMVDRRLTARELVEKGYKASFVERVFRLVQSSQYKRRLPLIAKLSHRTIDRDFRYPRDWGR